MKGEWFSCLPFAIILEKKENKNCFKNEMYRLDLDKEENINHENSVVSSI